MAKWCEESEKNIFIVGHRGVGGLYPENTMISFQAALDLKLELIEFDVHFTKEKELVVCHDADIERTTNGKGLIKDMTLAELKTYDAGIKKGEEFAGQTIPTLREVLSFMAAAPYEVLLNVEIKDFDHEVVDATVAMLKEYGFGDRCVIACFSAEIVDYIQKAHPEMRTQGYPARYMYCPEGFTMPEDLHKKMFGIGIPILEDDPDAMAADVAMAKACTGKAWLYCADNETRTRIAVEAGATNVTCNDPTATIKYLKERGLRN